jgi:hypothetical protein
MKDLSIEALRLWGWLDAQEKMKIQKDWPFRVERNEAIRALRRRGVTLDLIAEVTGISLVQIKRIAGNIKLNT